MKKMLFVYNPYSGKGELKQSLSDVISVFTTSGYDVTVHPTSKKLDGKQYISDRGEEFDIIVCSGGDGMLHELVCAMTEAEIHKPCGYIPSGTVNDFATSLNIPKLPVEAAKMIVEENYQDIDVGCFNNSNFAYVAAFGMFTNVSYATEQKLKNTLGTTAYIVEILKSIDLKNFYNSSFHAVIKYDDKCVEGDFIFGMAGNTLSVAGLKNLVPAGAEMTDGLLDGMFIKTPKTIAELEQIKIALIKQNLNVPNIICAKSKHFEFSSHSEVPWTFDGEFGGNYNNAEITIKKQAIKMAVPFR